MCKAMGKSVHNFANVYKVLSGSQLQCRPIGGEAPKPYEKGIVDIADLQAYLPITSEVSAYSPFVSGVIQFRFTDD